MIQSVFEESCCYKKWDSFLDGKLCFFADNLDSLKSLVDAGEGDRRMYSYPILASNPSIPPFLACFEHGSRADGVPYKLCYYDPLYDVKIGHRSGITVLRRRISYPDANPWLPDYSPTWDSFRYEYKLATSEDVQLQTSPDTNLTSDKTKTSLYKDLFDESFVFRCWDASLEGKSVYVGGRLESLKKSFLSDKSTVTIPSGDFHFPFRVDGFDGGTYNFRYVYYDPLLEFKRARVDGKVVEVCTEEGWSEVLSDEDFNLQPSCYRIRPESSSSSDVSNRELAYWLSQGYGEYCLDNDEVSYLYTYPKNTSNDPIPTNLMVRSWDETEWVRPTREYLGLDDE